MLTVSVVVPTFRRPKLLMSCLRSLRAQDLPASKFEIIVVDDDPEGRAEAISNLLQESAFTSFGAPSFRVLPPVGRLEGNHGPAAARNRGWKASRGKIIAFTDDDTLPDPSWLREGLRAFSSPRIWAVTGRVILPRSKAPTDYERNEAGLMRSEFVTANCFCRREVLLALCGFDERFTSAWREDSDLHFRLIERAKCLGMDSTQAIVHAPQAIVIHPLRKAPWGVSLFQQKKSMFNALLFKKHPKLYRKKIQASPPWHYYGAVTSLFCAIGLSAMGQSTGGAVALGIWFILTARFFLRRIQGASKSPSHLTEMALTSILVPLFSIYWRLRGAIRFRVVFF